MFWEYIIKKKNNIIDVTFLGYGYDLFEPVLDVVYLMIFDI